MIKISFFTCWKCFLLWFDLIVCQCYQNIEQAQVEVASQDFVARDDALAKVLGVYARRRCRGIGLGVMPTNLFGKIPYKEVLAISQAALKEKT